MFQSKATSSILLVSLVLLWTTILSSHAITNPPLLRTRLVAGGNNAGDNIPAISSITSPSSIAFSPISNHLHIFENDKIRKVDKQTGIITKIATPSEFSQASSSFSSFAFSETFDEIVYMGVGANQDLIEFNITSGAYKSFGQYNGLGSVIEHKGMLYFSQATRISTVNLTSGIIDDPNNFLTTLSLSRPVQLAIYKDDLYFAERDANRIRKFSISSNTLTTVACDGTDGFSGDGSDALLAQCSLVSSVALDKYGNIFIGDTGNGRIRLVNITTGNISTVESTGTLFSLTLKIDENGVLHVADPNVLQVFKLTQAGNGSFVKSLVAGNGGSTFNGFDLGLSGNLIGISPQSTAVVQTLSKDVILLEMNSKILLRVNASSGIVSKFLSFSDYINCIGADPNSNDIYVGHNQILKITSEGNLSVVAGLVANENISAVLASTSGVGGLATYGGDIYYSEMNGNLVRKIDGKTGIVTTFAGDSTGGYNGNSGVPTSVQLNVPMGISINSKNGDMLIADKDNMLIRKVSNGMMTTIAGVSGQDTFNGDDILATSAYLNRPTMALQSELTGEIYILESSRIRKILTNGTIKTIAGTGTLGYDSETLAINSQISSPNSMFLRTVNNQEELYFCDTENYRLRKIDIQGVISTVAGNGGSTSESANGTVLASETSIGLIYGAVLDSSTGDIYISTDTTIYRVFALNNTILRVAGDQNVRYSDFNMPLKTTFFSDTRGLLILNGKLYISVNSRIYAISISKDENQIVETIVGYDGDGYVATNARIGTNGILKITKAGDIYFIDNSTIRKISKKTNIVSRILGNGQSIESVLPNLNVLATKTTAGPSSFDIDDSTGIVYFTEASTVKMIDSNGYVRLVAGADTSGFSGDGGPAISALLSNTAGIIALPNGDLILNDRSNNRVRRISKDSGIIETIAGNGNPGYAIDGDNATLVALGDPSLLFKSTSGELYTTVSKDYTAGVIIKLTPYCTQSNYTIGSSLTCVPLCYGSTDCSGHGNCSAVDYCTCRPGYSGLVCEKFNCSGVPPSSPSVCSGNGTCTDFDTCSCKSGYYGTTCEQFNCFGISNKNLTSVCSGNGTCTDFNTCSCKSGYYGTTCDQFTCFGVSKNLTSVCSGRGACLRVDSCTCLTGFSGQQCEIAPSTTTSFKLSSVPQVFVWNVSLVHISLLMICSFLCFSLFE